MKSPPNKAVVALVAALALASCGTVDRPRSGSSRIVSDLPVKVGPPYQVGGRTYVPRDDARYDAKGYASWYGRAHRGLPTANGERFDPDAITAAHTTLPLPSYVAVTALDTGRTILVRVNDRGPFAAGRIIDLSQGAARLLGVERAGVARVRVRRVNPSEADRAALRAGRPAKGSAGAAYAETAAVPVAIRGSASGAQGGTIPEPASAAPVGAVPPLGSINPVAVSPSLSAGPGVSEPTVSTPAPGSLALALSATAPSDPPGAAAASFAFFVQIAALADADRADALASTLRSIGPAAATAVGPVWRVRLGPYASEGDALSALARARAAGYQDARVARDSAP